MEHCNPTLFQEPALDACGHYHRFTEDIRPPAELG
jgi:beta-glucosidase/6-phospho-beta-glucosidase/beta-galactosidase